ncbi:hypothetical protein [Burkholderia sp. Bp9143]|nr:hypothetical protein [Burkholderia sp. Bp9143]
MNLSITAFYRCIARLRVASASRRKGAVPVEIGDARVGCGERT